MSTTYRLVVPKTHRSGPGHRSHLSPRRGVTLCKIENNAKGLQLLMPHLIAPSTDVETLVRKANQHSCRKVCHNCIDIARRALTDSTTEEPDDGK